jgi:predicted small secreted protein
VNLVRLTVLAVIVLLCAALLAACGGGSDENSGGDESPGILVTASEGASQAADPSGETPECGGSQADGTPEREQLLAIICATYPGIGFDPECSEDLPDGPCIAVDWSDEDQAGGGVVTAGVQEGIVGGQALLVFAQTPEGEWAHWVTIGNGGGGPLLSWPGDMTVCAGGSGLNLREDAATNGALITTLPDGSSVEADGFVLTEPGDPANAGQVGRNGDGWYHIVLPQEGWAYDRFLLPAEQGPCGQQWWIQE